MICAIEACVRRPSRSATRGFYRAGPTLPALSKRAAVALRRRSNDGRLSCSQPSRSSASLLRTHNLGQDLWLDEISPIVDYRRLSAAQVIGSYLRSNNHLMNTLLLKASIASVRTEEWSVRIPAVTVWRLGIPALYWVARLGFVASCIARCRASVRDFLSPHLLFAEREGIHRVSLLRTAFDRSVPQGAARR